jgi:O-antigen ligase
MSKEKIGQYCLYLWLFLWPWQTKLILRPNDSNYLEISFFAVWLLLFIPLLFWGKEIFLDNYSFKKEEKKAYQWWGLIILESAILLSITVASDKLLSLVHYLIFVLGLSIFYLFKKKNLVSSTKAINILIASLITPAILGLWQFFTQTTFACKWWGLANHSAGILGSSVIETSWGRYLRAYGSFDHPNILGGVIVIGLLFILYSSFNNELTKKARIFYLSSFVILYSVLLVSFSRSALIAFFITAPLLFFKFKKPARSLIVTYACLVILISAAIIIPYKDLFLVRSTASGRLEQKSLTERTTYIEQAWSLIKEKPLQGVGFGNYTLALSDSNQYSQPVHNYWLLLWSEVGIFGLLGALIFWFYLLATTYFKNLYPIIIALFIFSLLDHWLLSSALGLLLFFVVAALVTREDI